MYSIPTVLMAQELLDKAFRRASKKTVEGPNPLKRNRQLLMSKIDSITGTLTSKLKSYVHAFPSLDQQPEFLAELIDALIGIDKLKKSLGTVDWGRQQLGQVARETRRKVGSAGSPGAVKQLASSYYGRVSSVIHQIGSALEFINKARDQLRKLPTIDPELPTIVVAGYPNVGKSYLVKKISSAKPAIATYPFTTKKIQIGHFTHHRQVYQVIDTPGLLDRPPEDRNEIERQAILALRHLASVIVFILDPSEYCGYTLNDQLGLLAALERLFSTVPLIAVENKCDLVRSESDRLKISAETGEGLGELQTDLLALLDRSAAQSDE